MERRRHDNRNSRISRISPRSSTAHGLQGIPFVTSMSTPEINPKDVMELRRRTGLGMMDCKKALTESAGDMKKAEALLRETLKGKMDARTDRAAGEGCISIAIKGDRGAIVEVRSETDFTSRNAEFRTMADALATEAMAQSGDVTMSPSMTAKLDDVRIKTGENVSFARGLALSGGSFAKYIHHDGKLGVIMQYEGAIDPEHAAGICLHIAGFVPTPIAVDEHGLPKDIVDAKRAEATAEAKATGKPEQVAIKIAEGKLRKYFEENTLLGQPYLKDPEGKTIVKQLVPAGAKILRFVRFRVGEGA